MAGWFHTTPQRVLMEIEGNPMLKWLIPIETLTKSRKKNKYYDYHEDIRPMTFECRELKKALLNWETGGN